MSRSSIFKREIKPGLRHLLKFMSLLSGSAFESERIKNPKRSRNVVEENKTESSACPLHTKLQE